MSASVSNTQPNLSNLLLSIVENRTNTINQAIINQARKEDIQLSNQNLITNNLNNDIASTDYIRITQQHIDLLSNSIAENSSLTSVQFRHIDIQAAQIQQLLTVIANLPNLNRLLLAYNHVHDLGIKLIIQNNMASLNTLILAHCEVSVDGIALLANEISLKGRFPCLTKLDVSENESFGDASTVALCTSLAQISCPLRVLLLSKCKIAVAGSLSLAEALKTNVNLTQLDLLLNLCQDQGVSTLCSALESNLSSHLFDLNLGANKFGYRGLSSLAKLLSQPLCSLKSIDIRGNILLPGELSALAKALSINSKLCRLNLCWNFMQQSSVAEIINSVISNPTSSLTHLNVSNCGLTDIRPFLPLFTSNSHNLRSLNLSLNPLGDKNAKLLANSIKTHCNNPNKSKTQANPGRSGWFSRRKAVNHYPLREILLKSCNFSDVGCLELVDCLRTNTTLTSCNLSTNLFTAKTLQAMNNMLDHNFTLNFLGKFTIFRSTAASSNTSSGNGNVEVYHSIQHKLERNIHLTPQKLKLSFLFGLLSHDSSLYKGCNNNYLFEPKVFQEIFDFADY
jgi:hypothetical protein